VKYGLKSVRSTDLNKGFEYFKTVSMRLEKIKGINPNVMTVKQAIPGEGCDVNQQLSGAQAAELVKAGMSFVIRYLPRTAALVAGNLTAAEMAAILGSGLNLMAVQHCPEPGWSPSTALGDQYGTFAGQYAKSIGYPAGAPIYLDLETPATTGTAQDAQDCINYVAAWFSAVEGAGYFAGLYIGYGVPLTPRQLYDLPVKSYWSAYNYNDGVATRGLQIVQHVQKTIAGLLVDPDTIQADELGDLPIWLSPN
jgi:Domain of unknown function (DUF1906)